MRSGPYTRVAPRWPSARRAHTSGTPSGTTSASSIARRVSGSSWATITRCTAAALAHHRVHPVHRAVVVGDREIDPEDGGAPDRRRAGDGGGVRRARRIGLRGHEPGARLPERPGDRGAAGGRWCAPYTAVAMTIGIMGLGYVG